MNTIDIDTSAFETDSDHAYKIGSLHGFGLGFAAGLAVLAIGWACCGCSAEVRGDASFEEPDAGAESSAAYAAAPSWCSPLTQANRACDVDPLVAFEGALGYQPATIFACDGPATSATPPDCQGWTTGECGVIVWGCGRLQ